MAAKDKEIVIAQGQESRLVKQTVFDLDAQQFTRVQFLAEAYTHSSFNPKKDNKPQRSKEDYILIMLKGMELGFSPMASVDNISIIQGKPSVDGKGMLAIAYASDAMEDIKIAGNEKTCTVTIKRKGIASPFSFTFTIDDAKAMELLSKQGSQYLKQPKVMLKWRAVANCLREALPDFLGGLYTKEELAPHDTIVSDGGDMDYEAPQLPASNPVNEISGNVPKDEWLEDVRHFCTPFYPNTPHRDNSIEKKLDEGYISRDESATVTAARMLMYCAMKAIEKQGLGLTETEVNEALGGKLSQFLKEDDNTFGTAWLVLCRYSYGAGDSEENESKASFDNIPF